jgi:hypothetical protein
MDRMSAVPPATPEEEQRTAAANRQAAYLGLVSSCLAIVGAFLVWVTITISGLSPPGSAQTGWDGGDGRTILAAGVAAAIASIALLVGRSDLWIKVLLLISGAIAAIIAIVNMVDAGSKAHDIQMQFGIPAGDVKAKIGIGLYLVVIGGAGLVAAGLRVRTSPS